jgi:nucleoid-associated protein YgaU
VQNLTIALVLIGLALLVGAVFVLHQFGPDIGLTPPLPDMDVKAPEEEETLQVTVGGNNKLADEIVEDAKKRLSFEHIQEEVENQTGAIRPSERRTMDEKHRIEHVVRKGETLSSIAREYLGDDKLWQEILDANKSLARPEDLREGQTILIPLREAR